MTNPLLKNTPLPRFSAIKAEHVEPALDEMLESNRTAIANLLADDLPDSWEALLQPLEELNDALNRMWSPVRHLHAVADNEALRAVYARCLPKLSDYSTEIGQNKALYEAYRRTESSDDFAHWTAAQRKVVEHELRDFRLSGIDLAGPQQERFKAIRQQLSKLQTTFEEHVLDATQAWKKAVQDEHVLRGLPETALALARQNAEREGEQGWLLTLDLPCYIAIVTHADDRELRREIYEAYVTRASDQGPHAGRFDNSSTMLEMLALRTEMAQLLGYANYAQLSLATKMAKDPAQVLQFLQDLANKARPAALKEFEELEAFARDEFGHSKVEAWDVAYFSEKLRRHRYAVSQEQIREYFPVDRVLSGLFKIAGKLYGVDIRFQADVDVWHPDVRFFEIFGADGSIRGKFYLDLFARPDKRGGAWMDECVVRRKVDSGVQLPVAYLTCNFTPPIEGRASLLSHEEIITLFHEFGHGLHHMMTLVDYAGVSGINGVAWDAVELPSQIMENWCWEREALALLSEHHKTKTPIDDGLFERLRSAKNFQAGMQTVRQLEFALFDFRLHMAERWQDSAAIQRLLDEVRAEVSVVPAPGFNRFQHGFTHIFAGGYAAGYYSYKWAEVLAADAFSKFEERGVFDEDTGREFLHTVLEQGGSREPMDLFVEFRGREPSIEPLLRKCGMADQN